MQTQISVRTNNTTKKRLAWTDCVKAVAIIAVVINHSYLLMYESARMAIGTFFSVTLFILVSGASTFMSYEKKGNTGFISNAKKLKPLLITYAVAVVVYILLRNKHFDLMIYLTHLINFNVHNVFYFVFFFIQLKLITPALLAVTGVRKKHGLLIDIAILAVLFFVAYVSINYTTMLPLYGGGEFLLGGTYLPVYFIGMMFAKYGVFNMQSVIRKILIIPVGALTAWWAYAYVFGILPFDRALAQVFGEGMNPPSANLIVYASLIFILLYCVFSLAEDAKSRVIGTVVTFFAFIGRHTLYIFMFHFPVQDFMFLLFPMWRNNAIMYGWVIFPCMVVLPAVAVWAVKKLIRNKKYRLTF